MDLTFEDCDNDTPRANCITIGDDPERISVLIPAGQLREFSKYVYPGDTHPKGKRVWHYSITYIEAR
jgi:hypothetical protein